MGDLSFKYPFSAIVGQEKLKRALMVNAINPAAGGVLIRGERGTGKSTAARALAGLLPQIEVVKGCPFSCHPHDLGQMCSACCAQALAGDDLPKEVRKVEMVTLPLNATEDKVAGTINMELVLGAGEVRFEPGVLARANRGILYIDEVNLLEDHLVDLLLDAAAMGMNLVEREGISRQHPARFIIVATMNPEEGELRPQLEDRFGLCVEVRGERDTPKRMEILRRRKRFGDNPFVFASEFQATEEALRIRIEQAQQRLESVSIDDDMLSLIARLCVELDAAGHRADIAMMNASLALAALDGDESVLPSHVQEAAELALFHRCGADRANALSDAIGALTAAEGESERLPVASTTATQTPERDAPDPEELRRETRVPAGRSVAGNVELDSSDPVPLPDLSLPQPPRPREGNAQGGGKRHQVQAPVGQGRYVGSRMPQGDISGREIALDATIRAAASRSSQAGPPQIKVGDLREKVRRKKAGSLILFVLDASASMHAAASLAAAKASILDLLTDAYQKRDRVGLVVFKDETARLELAPTSSISLARMYLENLTTGGSTPLCHGLALGREVIMRELRRNPDLFPVMVVITDGQGNVGYRTDDPMEESLRLAGELREAGIACVLVDTGYAPSQDSAGRSAYGARRVAEAMAADYYPAVMLKSDDLTDRISGTIS